jgi:hypothetical protein
MNWVGFATTGFAFSFAGMGIVQFPAQAQAPAPTIQLPPLHVEAPGDSCVDVQAGGAHSLSFDCLNQELKDAAQEHDAGAPIANAKDVTGTGAPTTVGTFSYTGTSIRMGDAFGKSAIPQRPPAPSFTNALVPSGAK